jgi:hypothetical protein
MSDNEPMTTVAFGHVVLDVHMRLSRPSKSLI